MRDTIVCLVSWVIVACVTLSPALASGPVCITRVTALPGDPTGSINAWHDVPGGFLLDANNGLFRYDGTRVTEVAGKAECQSRLPIQKKES